MTFNVTLGGFILIIRRNIKKPPEIGKIRYYNHLMDKEIIRNLSLTPQERIEEHQKALNLVLVLQKNKKTKQSTPLNSPRK